MKQAILAGPVAATLVLLFASHRAWLCRRTWVETIIYLTALAPTSATLAVVPYPLTCAVMPFGVLAACWIAAAGGAWRFMPDFGQRGIGWSFEVTLGTAFCSAVGVGTAMPFVALAGLSPAARLAVLALSAFSAGQIGRRLSRTTSSPSHS